MVVGVGAVAVAGAVVVPVAVDVAASAVATRTKKGDAEEGRVAEREPALLALWVDQWGRGKVSERDGECI